ncbi:MAG: polyribonucleotide nucleotidyltransferase [Myxococcota bacterium]|jgi:polyribonucleotide nucleotidyltransferase
MDFKVAGSADGITAVQADTKLSALPLSLLPSIFAGATAAIEMILATMNEVLGSAREALPDGAPQTTLMTVSKQHVGRVIGIGGKTINELSKRTRCKIDIQENGKVRIFAKRAEDLASAQAAIEALTEELEKGKVYEAEVLSTKDYGAFVKIGSHEGLVHISELSEGRVDKVEDVVKTGETIRVKVMGADKRGRLTLSMKAAS